MPRSTSSNFLVSSRQIAACRVSPGSVAQDRSNNSPNAPRAFVDHQRRRHRPPALRASCSRAALWRRGEAREQEPVGGQAREAERGEHRRGAGGGGDADGPPRRPRAPAHSPGRRPAACRPRSHRRPTCPAPISFRMPGAPGCAGMVVVGDERTIAERDAVDLHQLARGAGVFGGDHIGRGQNIQRAQGDIAGIADRGGDEVEPGPGKGWSARVSRVDLSRVASIIAPRPGRVPPARRGGMAKRDTDMFAFLCGARKLSGAIVAVLSLLWLTACGGGFAAIGGGGPRIDTSRPVPVALLVPGGGGNAADDALAALARERRPAGDGRARRGHHRPARLQHRRQPATRPIAAATPGGARGRQDHPRAGLCPNAAAAGGGGAAASTCWPSPTTPTSPAATSSCSATPSRTPPAGWCATPPPAARATSWWSTARTPPRPSARDAIAARDLRDPGRQPGRGDQFRGLADRRHQRGARDQPRPRDRPARRRSSSPPAPTARSRSWPSSCRRTGSSPSDVQYIGLQRWDVPASARTLPGLQNGWFAMPDPGLQEQFQQPLPGRLRRPARIRSPGSPMTASPRSARW